MLSAQERVSPSSVGSGAAGARAVLAARPAGRSRGAETAWASPWIQEPSRRRLMAIEARESIADRGPERRPRASPSRPGRGHEPTGMVVHPNPARTPMGGHSRRMIAVRNAGLPLEEIGLPEARSTVRSKGVRVGRGGSSFAAAGRGRNRTRQVAKVRNRMAYPFPARCRGGTVPRTTIANPLTSLGRPQPIV